MICIIIIWRRSPSNWSRSFEWTVMQFVQSGVIVIIVAVISFSRLAVFVILSFIHSFSNISIRTQTEFIYIEYVMIITRNLRFHSSKKSINDSSNTKHASIQYNDHDNDDDDLYCIILLQLDTSIYRFRRHQINASSLQNLTSFAIAKKI